MQGNGSNIVLVSGATLATAIVFVAHLELFG